MTTSYKVLKQSILISNIVGHLAPSHPTHFGYRQLCPTWPVRLANSSCQTHTTGLSLVTGLPCHYLKSL